MPARALLAFLLGTLLAAGAYADDAEQRARIRRERAEADARLRVQRAECEQRFVVTPCVDAARAEHRQTTLRLRSEEGVLDEAQRRQRAAARLAAIEDRQRAERERAKAPRTPRLASPPEADEPPADARTPRAAREVREPRAVPDRSADEARKRQRFDARQRAAQEHREQAAQRGKNGKKAAPLPDPAQR